MTSLAIKELKFPGWYCMTENPMPHERLLSFYRLGDTGYIAYMALGQFYTADEVARQGISHPLQEDGNPPIFIVTSPEEATHVLLQSCPDPWQDSFSRDLQAMRDYLGGDPDIFGRDAVQFTQLSFVTLWRSDFQLDSIGYRYDIAPIEFVTNFGSPTPLEVPST